MKKNAIKTTLISIISLYFISHVFSQAPTISNQYNNTNEDGTFSVCQIMKQSIDFTSELKPNIKKLKKMIGKVSEDTVLDYAICLHDFFMPENIVYYDAFQRAVTGEIYPNQKAIEEKQLLVVKDYILPIATGGNIRAIGFLCGRGYWRNSQALNFISKVPHTNPAVKFASYQLIFNTPVADGIELKVKYINKYVLADDSLLKSYFKDFKKVDLLRVRDAIDKKIIEIQNIKDNLPLNIDDPSFCLSFGFASITGNGRKSIVPKAFDGSEIYYDAVDFLEILRGSIDLILVDENPQSLAQLLFDYTEGKMQNIWTFDWSKPEDQYFINDKKWGPTIFKLLSAVLPYDTTTSSIIQKSYYLNRSAQLGASDAYFNLACLYQTLYYKTNLNKYSDSCIYYLEKLLPLNYPEAIALKGIKLFNGESYIKNKEEGVKLLIKAKDIGSPTAKILLETLPTKLFPNYVEGAFFQQEIKISDPWDFKVRCSNGCGKMTYPKEIIFGRIYDDNPGLPQIKKAKFFLDDTGNPIINITENDFRRTFVLAQFLNPYRKHVMCSETCQKEHEKKNNSNWDEVLNKRKAIDNEEIKCSACINMKKRKEMISITECPCYTESGNPINLSYTQSYDLYGDKEPKVCSSRCKIEFCKTKCAVKGYTSKY